MRLPRREPPGLVPVGGGLASEQPSPPRIYGRARPAGILRRLLRRCRGASLDHQSLIRGWAIRVSRLRAPLRRSHGWPMQAAAAEEAEASCSPMAEEAEVERRRAVCGARPQSSCIVAPGTTGGRKFPPR